MRKNFLFVWIAAFALLLLGAGCIKMPTDAELQDPRQDNSIKEEKTGGFNLSVESNETKTVSIKFNVPEDLKKNAEGYRIVMGRDTNPTKENATYWYQLGRDHQEKILTGMPTGIRHFRVCVIENNQCTVYSNDIEVDIK